METKDMFEKPVVSYMILLELSDKINKLEEKVFLLENGINTEDEPRRNKKYRKLSRYLKRCGEDTIKLTFEDIEEILTFSLPMSARRYRTFWVNSKSNPIFHSISAAGYRTGVINMEAQYIVFERSDGL